jgi:AcrR family transcriptional regulator
MDARELLLEAALKVYAEHGTRGATTRRIAHAAGVNEVTLFRHFGSKETLLREALSVSPRAIAFIDIKLPETPVDPEAELTEFCRHHHQVLHQSRSVIRKCMGEFEEHPETSRAACQLPVVIANALQTYLLRLRADGLARAEFSPVAASAMLMGTLFNDAMGRDCMPERFPYSEREAIRHYVALFLQAIGVAPAKAARRARDTRAERAAAPGAAAKAPVPVPVAARRTKSSASRG